MASDTGARDLRNLISTLPNHLSSSNPPPHVANVELCLPHLPPIAI